MISKRRSIEQEEIDVIRATLERARVREVEPLAVASVPTLTVVARCECGCASVDFEASPLEQRSRPLADGIGNTPRGGQVGIIVWGLQNAITGLEIYDLGAGEADLALPLPDSIVPWERKA